MPRYSVDLTDAEVAKAKAWAKKEDRTMASLMRCIFKSALHVGNVASIQRQNDVNSASIPRQNSAESASLPQSHSPARAPGTSQEECIEEVIPPKPPAKKAAKKRSATAPLADQEIASAIVEHLNEKAGTTFRPTGQSARQLISARLGEGYTPEDIRAVIDKKCAEWKGTEYDKFLRPSILFGKEKFEQYHGQKVGSQRTLDLTTEAGRAQCRKDAGLNDVYKPRPTLAEYLAQGEDKNG